ncbi:DNA mismatch repair protein Mlh3 isoform X3 [Gadus chalcogrammus]|uniref:DNA mismatch repair protein Mlh3 isoform X3 n=1 Tax=Gadus chalcogrammus TaxID=1042646 RepID=UPI0024C2A311|nr:DNA mismatch repair protein Mlh3 isoform X3 [Gadus chalcogrammus]
MIKCLSADVQSKIRSGIAISSLQQGVEELLLNSVDAGATCVGVRMDMKAFKVQVVDNGSGMDLDDLQRVGNRYCTSKCSSMEDLENLRFYGFRGEALASIVSLATLVEISSRTRLSVKTHVKVFKDGKGLDVLEAESSRPSAGTTLTICNFFHNMPVRRNRMDPVLEAERIRHRVEAISLMHPSVSFTLKNDVTGAMLAQLSKARSTYHRFVQIYGLGRGQHLREISHSQAQFKISGHIGIEGHYNKSLQFLYVNERLLLKTRLHQLLNFLLRKLNSSGQKNDSPDGQSIIRSPKQKRGQELHPIYIINIKCCYSEYDICLDPAKTLIEFKDWDGILICLEQAVKAFLSRENLLADPSQEELDCAPQSLLCTSEKPVNLGFHGTQLITAEASLSHTVCGTLSSGPVHRKVVVVDGALEESVAQTCVQDDNSSKAATLEPLEEDAGPPEMETIRNERPASVESRGGAGAHGSGCVSGVDQVDGGPTEDHGEGGVWHAAKGGSFTASLDNGQETSAHRIVAHQQSSNTHGESVEGFRKISLADAYIHESLPAKSHDDRPTFCTTKTCKQSIGLMKRKVSEVDYIQSSHKVYLDDGYNIASKVPKLTCFRKLLSKESASLDRFRSTYCKPIGEKRLSIAAFSSSKQPHSLLPQTGDIFVPGKEFPIAENETQNTDIPDPVIIQSDVQSLPTFSIFIKRKPILDKTGGGEVSLASKLSHLKQQRVVDLHQQSPLQSEMIDTKVDDNVQDSNNNNCSPNRTCGGPTAQSPASALQGTSRPELTTGPEGSTSGDWLDHFDDTLGRTVSVNQVTGLSRYEVPATGDTEVCCTSDVTRMAVNVVTETGGDKLENSLSSMYSKWKNPVFDRPPVVGVDVCSDQADGLAVKIHNILFPYRFSKAMITSMKVIHQVDKKFLACLINTRDTESAQDPGTEGNLLVLVDQHAAHERVRLEKLIAVMCAAPSADSYEDDPDTPGQRRLCSSSIAPPLELSVTEEELRLLRGCQAPLRGLGLQLELPTTGAPRVLVGRVPLCFTEKEHNEVRRGRPSVIKAVVEEYLRDQLEIFCSTGSVRGTLPLAVLRVLASLACHGAIKFNDVLSLDECRSLVGSLSSCQLPFQCAHGRPSIAPLADTLFLEGDEKETQRPNLGRLRRMYKAWELYGRRKL